MTCRIPRKNKSSHKQLHTKDSERKQAREISPSKTSIGNHVSDPDTDPDTDIVIVVGGQEFHERNRDFACSALIQRRVREHGRYRFNFGNATDVEEWILVRKLVNPFSGTCINKDNIQIALKWFKALEIHQGLEQCDQVLVDSMPSFPLKRSPFTHGLTMTSSDLDSVLATMPLAFKSNLAGSKQKCLEIVGQVLQESPFWLTLEFIEKIVYLLSSNPEIEAAWVDILKTYIPLSAANVVDDAFWKNPLAAVLILSGAESKNQQRAMRRQTGRIFGIIENVPPMTRISGLKKALKKDKVIRNLCPQSWRKSKK